MRTILIIIFLPLLVFLLFCVGITYGFCSTMDTTCCPYTGYVIVFPIAFVAGVAGGALGLAVFFVPILLVMVIRLFRIIFIESQFDICFCFPCI